MLKIAKRYFFEFLLFLLVVGIFVTNYVPGTYLIGWDSLQTELYPWLAVKRAFFSVWQEYQSFGLPSGMAHAADLLRALFIFLISFFLKQNLVRYVFHHLMLLVGGIGAFNLFKHLGFKSKNSPFAFLGATFYILNLGTVQMFALPFEPFSVFFAFLPWLILVFFLYIEELHHTKKTLNKFLLINILATPAFYQQTIFLVYIIVLGLLFLGLIVKYTFEKERQSLLTYLRNFFSVVLLIFIVNSFWLLPQFYTFASSADVTRQSKINQLATDTVMNKNIEKGQIQYLGRFENFYYDLKDINQESLFSSWMEYFENKLFYGLSFLPFVLAIVGLVLGKRKYDIPIAAVFIATFLIFMSGTPPLTFIWYIVREISIVGQVFRSPFTKFVFPFVLASSYFFVLGLYGLSNLSVFNDRFKRYFSTFSILFGFSIVALTIAPAFMGNYFLPRMKIKLPEQYGEVVKYFKDTDRNKRIALVPDYTFWGWYQNSWGYDGSGFIWYGVEQPIISRTFDVWSKESESYFWEMKRAVETQNSARFKNILNKYNINYLLVDRSAISITSANLETQNDRIFNIIQNIPDISLVKSVGNIDIYEFISEYPVNNFSYLSSSFINAYPKYEITDQDDIYDYLGNYINDEESKPDVIFPFVDLTTQTERKDRGWKISEDGDYFILAKDILGINLGDYFLAENEYSLESKIFDGKNITYLETPVNIKIYVGKIEVLVKKVLVEGVPVERVDLINCRNTFSDFGSDNFTDGILQIYSRNRSSACFSFGRPFLAHWNGYLIKVNSEQISGEPLLFYIVGNKSNTQSKIEEKLVSGISYFILGTGAYYDDGYIFGFQNISYKGKESVNRLKSLDIYVFPFDYVKNIKLTKKDSIINNPIYESFSDVRKNNYYSYRFIGGSVFHNTVVINQAYDPGWVAACGLGKCDAKHVKVNNWANGWVFEKGIPENVQVMFWPQFLEYIGFGFLGLCVLISFKYKEKEPSDFIKEGD